MAGIEFTIPEVPSIVATAYHSNRKLPVLVEGPHGIGKSSIFLQTADLLNIELVVLDLSLMESVDLLGMPRFENVGDQVVTAYAPPAKLPREGEGILLLEELNRCMRSTRAPALQLLTRRELHEYTLPHGWQVCACINPEGGDYEVEPLDPALLSRFLRVSVRADPPSWLRWAAANDLHPAIISYVQASPDIFRSDRVNPRALHYCSDYLKSFEQRHDEVDVLLAGWAGLVGETIATAMVRFMRDETKPLTSEQVVSAYAIHRAEVLRFVSNGRLDLVQATLFQVKQKLQNQRTWHSVFGDPVQKANVETFLGDVPADLQEEFWSWAQSCGHDQRAVP